MDRAGEEEHSFPVGASSPQVFGSLEAGRAPTQCFLVFMGTSLGGECLNHQSDLYSLSPLQRLGGEA